MENFEILTVKTGRESEGKSIKSVDTPWRQNVERWTLLAVGKISPTPQWLMEKTEFILLTCRNISFLWAVTKTSLGGFIVSRDER